MSSLTVGTVIRRAASVKRRSLAATIAQLFNEDHFSWEDLATGL
jgi:hypothetical protein